MKKTHPMIQYVFIRCWLGLILAAQSDLGVCFVSLGDEQQLMVNELLEFYPKAQPAGSDLHFARSLETVSAYIEHPGMVFDLPLDIHGTAYQLRVWQALREIPIGKTASYTEIAQRIGAPRSARAVALACAANKLAVIIPCHRVVRGNGSLSGYRWGVERKKALLEREAQQAS